MEDVDAVIAAAAAAAAVASGSTVAGGVVVRRGRSTLVRFGAVLARVRSSVDRRTAERELVVARALAMVGVPAIRPVEPHAGPIDVGAFVVTLWKWIHRSDRHLEPGEIGELATMLHTATSADAMGSSMPVFDPIGATKDLLVNDVSADAVFVGEEVDGLARSWREVSVSDPLGAAVVHGDLHAENVVVTGGHPVLIDLELAGIGPPSYDAAPAAIAVERYGADPSSLAAFLRSWPVDPRRWSGFETCCRVYEAWVIAWAVAHRGESAEMSHEAAIRVAGLRGTSTTSWSLR